MDNRLKGRIAVVTGASSGLGRATAIRFADSGARVVCSDINPSEVTDEITAKHGKDSATFVKCDVSKEEEIKNLMEEATKWGGRLDILATYAGIAVETKYGLGKRCHEMPTEDFDLTMSINTRGVWLSCKYALKQMMEQEPREPNARGERTRGWIVNAASMLGLVGLAGGCCYVPAKHAVVGMTKQMALDYAEDRIHASFRRTKSRVRRFTNTRQINCLCPGFVKSPMIKSMVTTTEGEAELASTHPWNSLGRPEDVADAALFLSSDEAAWVSGHAMVM